MLFDNSQNSVPRNRSLGLHMQSPIRPPFSEEDKRLFQRSPVDFLFNAGTSQRGETGATDGLAFVSSLEQDELTGL